MSAIEQSVAAAKRDNFTSFDVSMSARVNLNMPEHCHRGHPQQVCVANTLILVNIMHEHFSYKQYDPNRLLDTLRHRLGLNNDQALSQHLHISPKTLHKIRNGDLQLSATLLLYMAERAATNMEELRLIVGDRRRKLRLPCRIAA